MTIRHVWVRSEEKIYFERIDGQFSPFEFRYSEEAARRSLHGKNQLVEWPACTVMSGPEAGYVELCARFRVWRDWSSVKPDDVPRVAQAVQDAFDWAKIFVWYGGGLWSFTSSGDEFFRLDVQIPVLLSYDPKKGIEWHRYSREIFDQIIRRKVDVGERIVRHAPCLEHNDSMPCIAGVPGHEGQHVTKTGVRWSGVSNSSAIPGTITSLISSPPCAPAEPVAPPAPAPEPVVMGCSFCEHTYNVVGFGRDVRGCLDHMGTARLHVTRLAAGGLVHCPETCAETARFSERRFSLVRRSLGLPDTARSKGPREASSGSSRAHPTRRNDAALRVAMKIKIWDPNNESEDLAPWVEVGSKRSVKDEVQAFAVKDWSASDYWDKCTFNVRTEDGGLILFSVRAEQSIDFITEQLSRKRCDNDGCARLVIDDSDYCVDHQG